MTLKSSLGADARAGWEWGLVALVVGNVYWTTLCLGGFLAETMVVTAALNGALLMLFILERLVRGGHPLHRASFWLWPFLIYAAVNAAWITPVPWLGWKDWLNWAQLVLVFVVVLNGVRTTRARGFVFQAVVALGVIEVLLALYQRYHQPEWLMLGRVQAAQFIGRSSGSFGSPNSLAAFLVLLIPATAGMCFRRHASVASRIAWGYLTFVLGFGLVLTISRGAWISLGIVAVVAPLVVVKGGVARRLRGGALATLFVLAAFVAVWATLPAARDRITELKTNAGELSRPVMWQAAWRIFLNNPVSGGGAGSYGVLFDRYRPEGFQLQPRWAHNEFLNTLSDYGAIGGVLLFGGGVAIAIAGCGRGRKPRHEVTTAPEYFVAGLGAGLAAFVIQLGVDFGLKIPALGLTVAVVGALWLGSRGPAGEVKAVAPKPRIRLLLAMTLLATGVMVGAYGVPFYRSEMLRQRARRQVDPLAISRLPPRESVMVDAVELARRATQQSDSNADAWADLSYYTSLLAQFDPGRSAELGIEAERAADRALSRSSVVADFWVRKAVALDLQGRWIEAGAALIRGLQLAPTRSQLWYQQAAHLGLQQIEKDRALAAVAVSLRLDPGNAEAHALQRRLADRLGAP